MCECIRKETKEKRKDFLYRIFGSKLVELLSILVNNFIFLDLKRKIPE